MIGDSFPLISDVKFGVGLEAHVACWGNDFSE